MKLWDNFLIQQETELGTETVEKWLRPLKVLKYDACNLYLEAKDSFQITWFEEHIRSKILSKFLNNNNKKIRIHLTLSKTAGLKSHKSKKNQEKPQPQFTLLFDELDPYCTFEHYIPTEANLLPYKLLSKLSGWDPQKGVVKKEKSELPDFNPIYLYGPSGTGKTHLLMALGHVLLKQGLNAIYVRAETFTHHVVNAIRAGEMNVFRQTYRHSDVILLDDVHVLSRKGATQEELFHTFNTLHLAGKQIVLSSNCSPAELQMIEPRLVSRFEWGIVLSLESLCNESIATMLAKKAEALKFQLHPKVAEFLLQTFSRGTKSLSKALQALILRCHLMEASEGILSKQITVAQARQILNDLIQEEERLVLTPEKILQTVAEYFGIKSEDVLGKAQTRDFVLPRHLAMYFCRTLLKMPFMKIGTLFSKDHSTVMSSVKLIQKGIDQDNPDIQSLFNLLEKKLQTR